MARAQHDLAAPAERHAERRRDDRLAAVAQRLRGPLELPHHQVDLLPVALLGLEQQQHQVGAHREVASLVGDDEGLEVALGFAHGRGDHRDDVRADRVHLAVELQAQYAVAEVQEAGARVASHLGTRATQRVQVDGARVLGHGSAVRPREKVTRALRLRVEALLRRLQHRGDQGRQLQALVAHALGGFLHAHRVPEFERPESPAEPPAHRAIDGNDVVGDLAHATRGVEPHRRQRLPDERRRPVSGSQERPDALADPVLRLRRLDRGKLRLAPLAVLERLEVERENLAAALTPDLAVEPAAGLLAQQALVQHASNRLGRFEHVAHLVFGRVVVDGARGVHEHVDADEVRGTERRALRPPEQRTGERVHFLHGVPVLEHRPDGLHHAEDADAVGDEVGRVACDHDALAQHGLAELPRRLEHARIRAGVGNELEQVEVARRIEEVHAQKTRPQRLGHRVGHGRHRETGRVGGDDGALAQVRRDALEEGGLDVESLDDGLDDEVHVAQALEVVLEVAHADAPSGRAREERRGTAAQRALQPAAGEGVAVLARGRIALDAGSFGRNDVEQEDVEPGVGQVGGQRRSHHARTQHRRPVDG